MAVKQIKPATQRREIRDLCSSHPLTGDQLDQLYVDADAARNPEFGLRRAVRSILENAAAPKRILVYGHQGCGKSTELALLAKEMQGGWLCVNFSILQEAKIFGLDAEDILLIIAYKVVEAAKNEKLHSLEQDERIRKVGDWFKTVTETAEKNRFAELNFSAGGKVGSGGWLFGLAELFAAFRGDIKYSDANKTSIVEVVRKRPGDLVEQIIRVIECVEDALKAQGKRLLIIVEDLDKLNIADARKVFIEKGSLLSAIKANLIYTIPIFTFHSPDAGAMRAAFDHDFSLQMIKVLNRDGSRADAGFNIVRDIVHRRVDKSAIQDDALDLLIEKTGGVLRHVFEVLQTTANMNSLRELPIQKHHIEYGLAQLKANMGTQIALPDKPIDGLKDVKQLYDKLVERVQLLRAGRPSPVAGDPIIQVLLRCCALVEYNGERWLGVHPLVIDYLRDLGYQL